MTEPERIIAQFTNGSKPMALAIFLDSGLTASELKTELFKWEDELIVCDILAYFVDQMKEAYNHHVRKVTP